MVFFSRPHHSDSRFPWLVAGAPRLVVGTPYLVAGAPRCSHYKSFNCPGNGAMPLLSWHALQSPIPGIYPRRWHQNCLVLATVPGNRPSGPGLDCNNGSVRFQTRPKTRPADSWPAKPGPIPVNPRVSQGLARPVGSNLRLCVSGFTFRVAFRYAAANRKVLTLVCHG